MLGFTYTHNCLNHSFYFQGFNNSPKPDYVTYFISFDNHHDLKLEYDHVAMRP